MMEKEYEKRLKRWGSIKIFELKPSNKSDSERQKLENNAFLELMKPGTLPILLDEGGKMVTTKQIAESIQHWQLKGIKRVILGIGSANGWSDEIKKTTKEVWSLSKLTFPYQLARLILIEQLYRAFSIINNSPYHRE